MQAYNGIHQPANFRMADLARRRLIFDEFFYLQVIVTCFYLPITYFISIFSNGLLRDIIIEPCIGLTVSSHNYCLTLFYM